MEVALAMDDDVSAIGDQMAKLNSKDAGALLTYLKDEYNIEPIQNFVVQSGDSAPIDTKRVEVQTLFDVVLRSVDPLKKIAVIKIVRAASGLGIKEAKDLVDTAPKTIKEALSKDDAEKLKQEIEAAGGLVDIR